MGDAKYLWDAEDRVVAVVTGTSESDFTYDGLGRLVRIVEKQSGTVTADHAYAWCGTARCLEHDNRKSGSPVTKRYFAQGFVADKQAYYYVADALGSVRELVDGTGTVRAQYDYDPYGNATKIAGDVDSDIGYAGYFHHAATGLDFALRRACDPSHARWLNRDPIGEEGGLNLYGYVFGDPVNAVDPSGEQCATPPGVPWKLPGGQPIQTWTGYIAHLYISAYYQGANPGNTTFLNRSIRKITGDPSASLNRPDIFDATTGGVYEIKPQGSESQASVEANGYVNELNNGGVPARLGQSDAPGTSGSFDVPLGHIIFSSPEPGVITYSWEWNRTQVALAVAAGLLAVPLLIEMAGPAAAAAVLAPVGL